MPTQIAARAREAAAGAEAAADAALSRLPDDAVVDVEAEKREANSDEILDRLDREWSV